MERLGRAGYLCRTGLLASAAAAAAVAAAGPGTRFSLWGFVTGISILRWGAYLGAAGVLLSLAGASGFRSRAGRGALASALAGIALGAAAFGFPAVYYARARSVPAIHDISTDTGDPPGFAAILPLRAGAPNPAEYGGAELASRQHAAYPDIRTWRTALPPGRVFPELLAAARESGWQVVSSDEGSGRIEAVATTPWFGFRDDVVVRLLPEPGGGSRVDVRSVSRVGRSDVGTNARRIRLYLGRVAAATAGTAG